jgi:hypothetical protein
VSFQQSKKSISIFLLIVIQMKTFAIFSCAALFFTPLTANAQLRRAGAPGYGVVGNPVGAPGIPAAGEPGYADADDFGYGLVGNPIGAPGIPAVGRDVNLGGPINRRGLR